MAQRGQGEETKTCMKVAVVGATELVGASAVRALVAAGHDVTALAGTPEERDRLASPGVTVVAGDVFDRESLLAAFDGCDAVVSSTASAPTGLRAARPAAWREHDRLRTEGVRRVTEAAREAHVRRLVQESASQVYADHGEAWIDEWSSLGISCATEPTCVAETHVQEYRSDLRHGVVLRFGLFVGDTLMTRWLVTRARRPRLSGLGPAEGWVHPIHTDDVGPAVLAALTAPSGVYNVGAQPVRRRDLVRGLAAAVGRDAVGFLEGCTGPLLSRLTKQRAEPLTRSLRVSSQHFTSHTGWTPRRSEFDASWLHGDRLGSAVESGAHR